MRVETYAFVVVYDRVVVEVHLEGKGVVGIPEKNLKGHAWDPAMFMMGRLEWRYVGSVPLCPTAIGGNLTDDVRAGSTTLIFAKEIDISHEDPLWLRATYRKPGELEDLNLQQPD